ncbi:MAG: YggT family protein [Treponema sp.]|jgi:YggT family protein|nr:YggT family protein [Treponema sp.]
MRFIFNLLENLTGLYMLLIFIRVMLTWFRGAGFGRPGEILARITDPYLDWWRRFPVLQTGYFDLSPIAAMAALSLAQNIFGAIARYGRISAGFILWISLSSLWSAASFIIGFFIVVLILRLIAYLANQNIYNPFWRVVDAISQPVLYRITRIFFRARLINYLAGIFLSVGVLAALLLLGSLLVFLARGLLLGLPF